MARLAQSERPCWQIRDPILDSAASADEATDCVEIPLDSKICATALRWLAAEAIPAGIAALVPQAWQSEIPRSEIRGCLDSARNLPLPECRLLPSPTWLYHRLQQRHRRHLGLRDHPGVEGMGAGNLYPEMRCGAVPMPVSMTRGGFGVGVAVVRGGQPFGFVVQRPAAQIHRLPTAIVELGPLVV